MAVVVVNHGSTGASPTVAGLYELTAEESGIVEDATTGLVPVER